MIRRTTPHTITQNQVLSEESFTGKKGIDITQAPVVRDTVEDLINMDIDLDGAMTIRKPIKSLDILGTLRGNITYTKEIFDNNYFYIVQDDTDQYLLTTSPLPVYLKDVNYTFLINDQISVTDYYIDISNATLVNMNTSSLLTNVKIDLTHFMGSTYYDSTLGITEVVTSLRLYKGTHGTEPCYYLEYIDPYVATIESSETLSFNPNTAGYYTYALRDSYNTQAVKVNGILAYTNGTASTVKGLTETNKNGHYIISSLNKDYSNAVILKAFCNFVKDSPNTKYYCLWEYSYDNINWNAVPTFINQWQNNLEIIPVTNLSSINYDLSTDAKTVYNTIYKQVVPMNIITGASQLLTERPDVLSLTVVDKAVYRFVIYSYTTNRLLQGDPEIVTIFDTDYDEFTELNDYPFLRYITDDENETSHNFALNIETLSTILENNISCKISYNVNKSLDVTILDVPINISVVSTNVNTKTLRIVPRDTSILNISVPDASATQLCDFVNVKLCFYYNESELFTYIKYQIVYTNNTSIINYSRTPDCLHRFWQITNATQVTVSRISNGYYRIKFDTSTRKSYFTNAENYIGNSTDIANIGYSLGDIKDVLIHSASDYYNFKAIYDNVYFSTTTLNQAIKAKIKNGLPSSSSDVSSIDVVINNRTYSVNKNDIYTWCVQTDFQDIHLGYTQSTDRNSYANGYSFLPIGQSKSPKITLSSEVLIIFNKANPSIILSKASVNTNVNPNVYTISTTQFRSALTNNIGSYYQTGNMKGYIPYLDTNFDYIDTNIVVASEIASFQYTMPITVENSILNTDFINSNLGKKLYYKYRLYSYGDPSFKNNIYVSNSDSLITPLFNAIDLPITDDSIITSLIPWREYLIASSEQGLFLITPVDDGFTSKILSTFIGIPKKDGNTLKAILNGAIFKSGSKIYILQPSIYASNDSTINIVDISKQVSKYIIDTEYDNFAFTTEQYYFLCIPDTDSTTVLKYEFATKCWTKHNYPDRFISAHIISLDDIRIISKDNVYQFNRDFASYVTLENNYVGYGDILNGVITPIHYEINTGPKSYSMQYPHQFVETKILFGVLDDSNAQLPLQVDIYSDNFKNILHIDPSTSNTLWRDNVAPREITNVNDNFTILTLNSDTIADDKVTPILKQLFLRYSGKGFTVTHHLKGESNCYFKCYVIYTRFKETILKK